MTIIQSSTTLWNLTPDWWPNLANSVTLYEGIVRDYDVLYKTQPNVRVCVDYLARNLAQLGLDVFKRTEKNSRDKVRDHPLIELLNRPLPVKYKVTRFRLMETLMGDLGVYYNAYWLKIRNKDDGTVGGLLRIPPSIVAVKGGLTPKSYEICFGGDRGTEKFDLEEIIHFRGYNAGDPVKGLSPLETLRRVLAEEHSMGDYREHFWESAARMGGVLERPVGAPEWSETARGRFKQEFEELYSGSEGSGKTAILEEGMTWKQASFNPQEAEYLSSRKLSREECARAYHIPPPLIGILDHATYCLPAGTLIYTSRGPKPIERIEPQEQVWSHNGAHFELKEVLNSQQSGIDPILEIKTQNRTLKSNERHPVLVRKLRKVRGTPNLVASAKVRAGQSRWHYEAYHDYVPAGELKVGDIIVVANQLPVAGQQRFSIPRMEFYGLYVGDGSHGSHGLVSIARADDADYMDYYREVIENEFINFGRNGNGTTRDVETQPVVVGEGRRKTRFHSILALEELLELGFGGTSHTKRVPDWVFKTTREERLAFLRGLFEADGSVNKKGQISYSSVNKNLVEDVRHLCFSLGIPVNNIAYSPRVTTLPNGEEVLNAQHKINLSDPGSNREIGSHSPRDLERLEKGKAWSKKRKEYPFSHNIPSNPPEGCQYSKIVRIAELPTEPVYDLEVADNHSFIASGVVVHNSNIETQQRALYTDVLGPWMQMIQQEIELQLLGEMDSDPTIYLEFNMQEKLRGDFEEQSRSLQSAVGRPWMTANEGRAIMNMPRIEGGDELVTPLNVISGAQASPLDSDSSNDPPKTKSSKARYSAQAPELEDHYQDEWKKLFTQIFDRQQRSILPRLKSKEVDLVAVWDTQRWDEEVGADMAQLGLLTAHAWSEYLASKLGLSLDQLGEVQEYLDDWTYREAMVSARNINGSTRRQLEEALSDLDPLDQVKKVFNHALSARVFALAIARLTLLSNFSTMKTAEKKLTSKTWRVTSGNPRDSHAAINGETVGIRDVFSNGLRYPGDFSGGAEENANCKCVLDYGYE